MWKRPVFRVRVPPNQGGEKLEDWTRTRDTRFYLKVFAGLTTACALEIATVYVIPYQWLRAVLLLSLASCQALLLAMNIMHLRWERLIFSFVFFLGFGTSVLLVLVLTALFHL